jgi:hypothetical protein
MKYILNVMFFTAFFTPFVYGESTVKYNIHLASYHFNRDYYWNEKNYGAGIEYGDNTYVSTGYFRNSYNKNSLYVITGILCSNLQMFLGVATGYPKHLNSVTNLRIIGGISKTFNSVKLTLNNRFVGVSVVF